MALAVALAALLALAAVVSWRAAAPPEVAGAPAPSAGSAVFPFDPVNPPPAEESERRFAEAPDDVVAGSALALRLARDGRTEEARIVIGRLRQIPGAADDPLVDYTAGQLANRAGEAQGALVFFTRARDSALAQGRSELLGAIRLARGGALTTLGRVDAALAELEQARSDLARAGDHGQLYGALNDLAVLHCQRGDLDAGEAMYEQALESARIAGFEPAVVLINLADVKLLRGRPDLAEPLAREALDGFRRSGHPGAVSSGLVRLSQVVRDLGRSAEADAHLDEALSVSRIWPALQAQAVADLERGRLDRIDALVSELEAVADTTLQRRPLAAARSVAGLKAALAGDLAAARPSFSDSRRLFRSEGDLDLAALSDVAWAEAEAAAGDPAAAARILDEALAGLEQAAASLPGFSAELLRARIDAESGRLSEALRRLETVGEDPAGSPSLGRRLGFLRARARLAAAEDRPEAAHADLEAAIAAARPAQRTVQELELRLDLAAVAADPEAAARLASEVEREASRLGLTGLAARARAASSLRPAA